MGFSGFDGNIIFFTVICKYHFIDFVLNVPQIEITCNGLGETVVAVVMGQGN